MQVYEGEFVLSVMCKGCEAHIPYPHKEKIDGEPVKCYLCKELRRYRTSEINEVRSRNIAAVPRDATVTLKKKKQ